MIIDRRILLLSTLLTTASIGCSTSYTPKRDGRVRLVMETGALALAKDGNVVREDGAFSTLVTCDDAAKSYAYHGQQSIKSGRDLAAAAAVLNIVLGPGNLIGLPLSIMAQNDINRGYADMIDAMNRHNDAETCVATTQLTQR